MKFEFECHSDHQSREVCASFCSFIRIPYIENPESFCFKLCLLTSVVPNSAQGSGGVVATFESRKQEITGSNPTFTHRSGEGCAKDSVGSMQSLPADSAE